MNCKKNNLQVVRFLSNSPQGTSIDLETFNLWVSRSNLWEEQVVKETNIPQSSEMEQISKEKETKPSQEKGIISIYIYIYIYII